MEKSIIPHNENEKEVSKWRMDSEDGMRPLKLYRQELLKTFQVSQHLLGKDKDK